jgi:hypothetical protein
MDQEEDQQADEQENGNRSGQPVEEIARHFSQVPKKLRRFSSSLQGNVKRCAE